MTPIHKPQHLLYSAVPLFYFENSSTCWCFPKIYFSYGISRVNYFRSLGSFRNAACFRRSTIYFYGFSLSYRRVPTPPSMCHNGNEISNSIAKAWFHTFRDATFHSNRFYDAWSSTISRSHGNNLQLAVFSPDLSMETNGIKFIDFNTSLSEVLPIFEFELRLEAILMSGRSCFIC